MFFEEKQFIEELKIAWLKSAGQKVQFQRSCSSNLLVHKIYSVDVVIILELLFVHTCYRKVKFLSKQNRHYINIFNKAAYNDQESAFFIHEKETVEKEIS